MHGVAGDKMCVYVCCCVSVCRMSISWSRLIPGGVCGSPASPEGVKFYKSVFEELKKNGIEPAVTLYHWDMPQVGVSVCGWRGSSLGAAVLGSSSGVWCCWHLPPKQLLLSVGWGLGAGQLKACRC